MVGEAGHARVVCTRKTTPGLRVLEKYAVRVGGASNHRFGLYDAVLIKDNHRVIAGGVQPAVAAARAALGHLVTLEVEVDTVEQLEEAIDAGADAVLLDNMSTPDLERAVARAGGRVTTEASGGITAETICDVAGDRRGRDLGRVDHAQRPGARTSVSTSRARPKNLSSRGRSRGCKGTDRD